MLLVSVSLLKHINTNSSSFYSTKRKIERKFEESKNPSYFVKAKDPRIDRDRNKILMLLVSVSLLKHINTNCSSFYSTKRKIERKFEESKNPSYFERSSNRSR